MSNIIYNTFLKENISFYSNITKEQSLQLYKQIIKFRKVNKISKDDIYCEEHHIIPRSICKDKIWKNFKENKVNLLPYEHFICHYLLTKITDNSSLLNAFWMMCNASAKTNKREYIKTLDIFKKSKEYEKLRKKFSVRQSKIASNKHHIYNKELDIQKCVNINDNIPNGYVVGCKPVSNETRKKLSDSLKGRISNRKGCKLTDAQKEKLSKASSGTIFINNGIINKRINKKDLINYDATIWKIGLNDKTKEKIKKAKQNISEETKNKMSNAQKNRFKDKNNHPKSMLGKHKKWINDGIISKMIDINITLPDNWKYGRIKKCK